jgi:hypothetical protein
MEAFSTRGLRSLFSYPLRKAGWEKKMLILTGFYLGGLVIPVFPWLFAYGYTAEIIRRAVQGDDPELPDWNNWNDLLMDGLRLAGILLIYTIPLFLIFGFGFASYFGTIFLSVLGATSRSEAWIPLSFFPAFSALMCSLICGTIFAVFLGILMPAAITHVVVKRSFTSFFHFGGWWQILRANLGGYIIFFVLLGGILFIWQIIYSLIAWTFILLPVALFLPILAIPYVSTITAVIFGRIYREAQETIALDTTPPAAEQSPTAEEPII